MEGRKMTEIGEIPEDWEVNTIARTVGDRKDSIVAGPFGSNLKVEDYKVEGIPIIRLQNIEFGKFVNKDIKYISSKKAEELDYHSFIKGDIVLAKLGDPIGKTCIVPDFLEKGIVVADVVRIRVNEKLINKKYTMYILNSFYVSDQLNRGIIGTTRPRVNLDQVRNLLIPLPPLPEQRRIAEVLGTVDSAIQKVGGAIETTERLKKGLMQRTLTKGIGHEKFKESEVGKIPEEWKVARLGDDEVTKIRGNKTIKGFERVAFIPMDYVSDSDIFVNYENRPMGEVKSFTYCERGDLLLAKITPSLENGKQGIVPDRIPNGFALATTEVFPISCKGVDRLFLYYILKFPKFRNIIISSMIGTTGRQRASKESVEKLLIPLPPLPEQRRIAEILSAVDRKLALSRRRKEKLERVKRGLMNDLLTGKKRVKVKTEMD